MTLQLGVAKNAYLLKPGKKENKPKSVKTSQNQSKRLKKTWKQFEKIENLKIEENWNFQLAIGFQILRRNSRILVFLAKNY